MQWLILQGSFFPVTKRWTQVWPQHYACILAVGDFFLFQDSTAKQTWLIKFQVHLYMNSNCILQWSRQAGFWLRLKGLLWRSCKTSKKPMMRHQCWTCTVNMLPWVQRSWTIVIVKPPGESSVFTLRASKMGVIKPSIWRSVTLAWRMVWGHCHFLDRWVIVTNVSRSNTASPWVPLNLTGVFTLAPLKGSLSGTTVVPSERSSSPPTCVH